MSRGLAIALTLGALLWAGAVVAAPYALTRTPAAASVYALSSRICHQRPSRSFHLAGTPMPVCARCAGLYVSGAAGALLGWVLVVGLCAGRRQALLLAAAAPTALTWGSEMLGLHPFSEMARAAAAAPLGLVAGWLFVVMLRYDASLDGHQIHDGRSRARSV